VLTGLFIIGQNAVLFWSSLRLFGCAVPLSSCLFVSVANEAIKFPFPGPTGEFAKPLYLARRHGIPLERGGASVVLVILARLVSVCFFAALGSWIDGGEPWPLGLVLLAAAAGLWALHRGPDWERLARRVPRLERVWGAMAELRSVLALDRQGVQRWSFFGLNVGVAFFGELWIFLVLAAGLGIEIGFPAGMFLYSVCLLITRVPVTMQGIGSREGAILVLFAAFGSREDLFALAVVFTAIVYIFPVLIGIPFAQRYSRAMLEAPRADAGSGQSSSRS
jgi:uncharacterized membrane protein YbhN (UPF0104 family)